MRNALIFLMVLMVLSMFSCSLDKFEKNSPDSDSVSVQSDIDASENDNNTSDLEKTDDSLPESEHDNAHSDETEHKDDNIPENDEVPDLFKDDFEPDDAETTDNNDESSTDFDSQISDTEPVDSETDDDMNETPDEDLLEPYKNFTTVLFGTDKNESGLSLAMDNDGNLFLTGYTEGNLNGQINSGEGDIFLIKFDSYGNKLWTKLYGAEKNDSGNAVKIDSSGNIYLTGYTEGSLEGNANKGGYDVFLMKLDKDGEILWVKQIGNEGADVGMGIVFDETENIYISGYIDGSYDDPPSIGTPDAFLAKFSQDGTPLWLKKWGSENYDAGVIASFHNGYIYVPGFTNGDISGTGFLGGIYDAFLTKLDTDGNIVWTKQLGTGGMESVYSLEFDSNSNMFLCGSASGEMENPDLNDSGVSLTKLDSDGNFEWTNIWNSDKWEGSNYIISDSSDHFYLSGFSLGNLDGYKNAGEMDVVLMKTDSFGNKLWTKLIGGENIEISYGSIMDMYGNIYITGTTMSDLGGNKNAGETDIFLVKINAEDL